MEGSEDDLTHMEFLGHERPEEEVCVEVITSLAVRDPTGTQHTDTFWVRRTHARKSGFFRIRTHPALREVGQQLAAGRL